LFKRVFRFNDNFDLTILWRVTNDIVKSKLDCIRESFSLNDSDEVHFIMRHQVIIK